MVDVPDIHIDPVPDELLVTGTRVLGPATVDSDADGRPDTAVASERVRQSSGWCSACAAGLMGSNQ